MVGGRIARLLLQRGDRVRAFVRPSAGSSRAAVTELEALGTEIVYGDVTDPASTAVAVDGCADIYHCAALVDPFHWNLADYDRVNVGGTRNVLDAALATGARRFLHVSSISALGAEPGTRADESITATGPMRPGYGRSKFLSEELVRAAAGEMHIVSVNPGIVFGPADRHFVMLIRAFLRGRLPVIAFAHRPMSLVYVDDVARGSLLALERGESGARYLLVQPTVTVAEFFAELAAASGRRPPRLRLPDWLAIAGAMGLWAIAPIMRRRPPVSSFRGLRIGPASFDGGLATRELGLEYTPLGDAINATVAELLSSA